MLGCIVASNVNFTFTQVVPWETSTFNILYTPTISWCSQQLQATLIMSLARLARKNANNGVIYAPCVGFISIPHVSNHQLQPRLMDLLKILADFLSRRYSADISIRFDENVTYV